MEVIDHKGRSGKRVHTPNMALCYDGFTVSII